MQLITFLQEVKEELNKVVWPSREQTIKMTLIVIIVTVIVGAFIGGIDYLLAQLTQFLLSR